MDGSLFSAYTDWHEHFLPIFRTILPRLAIALFFASACCALPSVKSLDAAKRCLLLSISGVLFCWGAYLTENPQLPLLTCLILVSAYIRIFGVALPTEHSTSSRATVVAALIILCSTALKLYELEVWPPLLNDYAARTGVEAYLSFANTSAPLPHGNHSPYLYGGGTSILHAPIVLLAYNLFGYSVYAVRFAEVVGSTASLVFLWLLLRSLQLGTASLVALLLFACSAEHIATSRMGTFYSISQALSLCILWLTTEIIDKRGPLFWLLIPLVGAISLLPFAYAPAAALFVFVALRLISVVHCSARSKSQRFLMATVALFATLVACSTWYQQVPFRKFTNRAAILATDTPVWFKADDRVNFRNIQPLENILLNVRNNARIALTQSLNPTNSQEPIYAFAAAALLCVAFLGLGSARWRTLSLYSVLGFLPLLAVYPLQRRGMPIRPFIPLALALFVREYLTAMLALVKRAATRYSICVVVSLILLSIPLNGLYLFAKYNSPIGLAPSFGPEHAKIFIERLKNLSKERSIVILNTGNSRYQYQMQLAESCLLHAPLSPSCTLADVSPSSKFAEILPAERPLTIAVLQESKRAWIVPALKAQLPTAEIEEVKLGETVLYWLATLHE